MLFYFIVPELFDLWIITYILGFICLLIYFVPLSIALVLVALGEC